LGTDEDWVVGVVFADESTFSLGENDLMTLDEPMTESLAI